MLRVGSVSLRLVLAVALALLSVRVQRRGPEQAAYGNVCGPTGDDLCYRPVLKGGFPVAYLFDTPGVSVENQLAFVEDDFEPLPFALDAALFFAAVTLGARIASRARIRRA